MPTKLAPTALHINLQRLLIIRLIVFVCQVAALFYAQRVLALDLNYQAIIVIFFCLALLNGALYMQLRKRSAPGELEFLVHLLLDVIGLSLLLYFSGGANNPFVSYYLVPITIAAATLNWRYTWLLSVFALLCYTTLLFFYQPLAIILPAEAAMHMHEETTSGISLHIIGMWFNFLVSAALITWFVVKMATEIRRQQDRLSLYREDTLRNEQVLAVATQAAGTAHELGTPLGTMAILLKDLQLEQEDPQLLATLQTLQQQVERCRSALQQLSLKADFKNIQTESLTLGDFIRQVLDEWHLLQPECSCKYTGKTDATPIIQCDQTLRQALINILNNAADASPSGITLELDWNESHWTVKVRDFGDGISWELQEQLGTSIISTKKDGMGVGLVLSQVTINRLGGTVSMYPMDDKGTLTEISLPFRLQNPHE